MRSSLCALATMRGSLVYTPSTSVKMSQRSAPSAAASATAEVSEPPRPSVVTRWSADTPWNPASTATSPRSRQARSRFGFDALDARPAVDAIGAHRRLPAEEGARRQPERVQRQRQQPDRDLLARRRPRRRIRRGRGAARRSRSPSRPADWSRRPSPRPRPRRCRRPRGRAGCARRRRGSVPDRRPRCRRTSAPPAPRRRLRCTGPPRPGAPWPFTGSRVHIRAGASKQVRLPLDGIATGWRPAPTQPNSSASPIWPSTGGTRRARWRRCTSSTRSGSATSATTSAPTSGAIRWRSGRSPACRVVDVGCGGGLLCEPLARLGATVTGIDLAPASIEAAVRHARAAGLAIDYRVAAAEELVAERRQFDLVCAMEVVEHVADQAGLSPRLRRAGPAWRRPGPGDAEPHLPRLRARHRRRRVRARLAAARHAQLAALRAPLGSRPPAPPRRPADRGSLRRRLRPAARPLPPQPRSRGQLHAVREPRLSQSAGAPTTSGPGHRHAVWQVPEEGTCQALSVSWSRSA